MRAQVLNHFVFVFLLSVFCTFSAFEATAQIALNFDPDTVTIAPGESVLVAVTVDSTPAPGLAATQVRLAFDQTILSILNPNEAFRGTVLPFTPLGGDALCTTVRGTPTCEDPDWLLTSTGRIGVSAPDVIDQANGIVEFVFATYGPAPPLAGGVVALIEIQGIIEGVNTVTIGSSILADNFAPPNALAFTPGNLTVTVMVGGIDTDLDGIPDNLDNCILLDNPTQLDSNGDNYGNRCDPDIDNSGTVNFGDYVAFVDAFLATPGDANWNPDVDMNGDNIINFFEFSAFVPFFLQAPGPSGLAP